jgi:hypothetical protein
MAGPVRGSSTSLRLIRQAESSRLQLELVRRVFELLVPHHRHPIDRSHGARQQRSAAAAARRPGTGG